MIVLMNEPIRYSDGYCIQEVIVVVANEGLTQEIILPDDLADCSQVKEIESPEAKCRFYYLHPLNPATNEVRRDDLKTWCQERGIPCLETRGYWLP